MIAKVLTLVFALLVIAKYVFNAKIHEKYIFGVAVLLALLSNFGTKYNAIEMFDGSSVAFDKEAFENLNRIVNEIAGNDSLTIPGNLIVQGTAQFDNSVNVNGRFDSRGMFRDHGGDSAFKNKKTNKWTYITHPNDKMILDAENIEVKGKTTLNNDLYIKKNLDLTGKFICRGPSQFECQKNKGNWSHMNWTDGKTYFRDIVEFNNSVIFDKDLVLKRGNTTNATLNYSNNNSYISRLYETANNKYIHNNDTIRITTNGENDFRYLYDPNKNSKNNQQASFDQAGDITGNEESVLRIFKA